MKQAVLKRLGQLEERRAAAVSAAGPGYDGEDVREWLDSVLRAFKTEPGPNESLMDALARCIGLRTSELRELMRNADEFYRAVWVSLERALESRGTA